MKKHHSLSYFAKNISTVIGIVMIWRGIWIILDKIDMHIFGGSHTITALAGIIVGLLILYIPDKDLKEIQNI